MYLQNDISAIERRGPVDFLRGSVSDISFLRVYILVHAKYFRLSHPNDDWRERETYVSQMVSFRRRE